MLQFTEQCQPQRLTSPTQVPSHAVAQQNESAAQIVVTQLGLTGGLSHPEVSALPIVHNV
jgi:hypothetical protein